VRVAGDDRLHLAERADPLDGLVVQVADRVPEQAALAGRDQHRLLADPGAGLGGDPVQAGLDLLDVDPVAGRGQLLQGGPVLAVGRHPLPLVGADRADLDLLAVLDRAGRADPETHRRPLSFVPRRLRADSADTRAEKDDRREPIARKQRGPVSPVTGRDSTEIDVTRRRPRSGAAQR
jgi:hypothetical protein